MDQQHKTTQQKHFDRRHIFDKVVYEFRNLGFTVVQIDRFCYRFNDCLDIFPANKKFYDRKSKARGKIKGLEFGQFIRNYFGLK